VKYTWQNGNDERQFLVDAPGQYSVEVENVHHCLTKDSILIEHADVPDVNLGADTVVCDGPAVLVGGVQGRAYLWSTGDTTSTLVTPTEGTYWLKATNECGIGADTITVHAFDKLFVPNVVTFNEDNFNKHFVVTSTEDRSIALGGKLSIYDRYGTLVYQDEHYRDEWPFDETISAAVYYYIFEVPGCPGKKGSIYVFR
jgi:hypothetical protein